MVKMTRFPITLVGIYLFLLLPVQGHNPSEYYTSVSNLEYLLESELGILDRLDKYIEVAEEQIQLLKRQRTILKRETKDASKDRIGFVSNPIKAFLMTKRLVKDYKMLDELTRNGLGVELINGSTRLPTMDDYVGIAEGLAELQDLYLLETVDLARGLVKGQNMGRELTAEECYSIGVAMSNGKQYEYGIRWLREALRRLKDEESPGVSEVDILDYLANALNESYDYEEAEQVNDRLLEIKADHVRGVERRKIIKQWLKAVEEIGPRPKPGVEDRQLYGPLCRGEYKRPAAEISRLYCQYEVGKTPFTKIAPFKMEVFNLDPWIVLYYDVLSEKEIDKLIELGKPKIVRSMVGDAHDAKVSKVRTSQNGWLYDYDHQLVERVSLRTQDMTGLDIRAYEALQMNNYGIGGHYTPHFDWTKPVVEGSAEVLPETYRNLGNRIATLMFYLSDVQLGGATVFPKLGVGVFPRKGSAIYWNNLHHDGTGDERTLHGACPVLLGSKWVANKWIHERYQEFIKPCGLHFNDKLDV